MNIALIVVDGVLRKLSGGSPIPEGVRLYQSLVMTGGVILLSEDGTPATTDWLELNGCVQHDFVRVTPPGQPMVHRVNVLRREGYPVDLVVVPDPDDARLLIAAGLNTVLFTHAEYAHPDWRPDAPKGVQTWAEIVDYAKSQARAKATDVRLRNEE